MKVTLICPYCGHYNYHKLSSKTSAFHDIQYTCEGCKRHFRFILSVKVKTESEYAVEMADELYALRRSFPNADETQCWVKNELEKSIELCKKNEAIDDQIKGAK
ncbi:MAG: hypothetical protein ACOX2M_03885 [Fastidiosipilaceae bacterium]|jgi:transposase-like protein